MPIQKKPVRFCRKRKSTKRGARSVLQSPTLGIVAAQLPKDFARQVDADMQTQLGALVKDHGLESSTEVLVRSGSPQHEIVSLAKEKAIDLIIIASHQPGVADYLLGSVAAAVVRHAPCSVLVKR